jgi:hypothetical protein
MRTLWTLVISAALCGSAVAQGDTPSTPQEVMMHVREAYKTAMTDEEKASVIVWCKDKMGLLGFYEHDLLMVEALLLLQNGKTEEANALLDRDKASDAASKLKAAVICRAD